MMHTLSQKQTNYIHDCIVAINKGTGFFILPGIIVTCYHNIRDFDKNQNQINILSKDRNLTIKKIITPKNIKNPDLVIIEIHETDHPFLPIGINRLAKGEIYSYGYQYRKRNYNGYPIWGSHGDVAVWGSGIEKQELIVILEANIQPGMSGSPLFSVEERKVIGIINKNNPEKGGYAIPIRRLEEFCNEAIKKNNLHCENFELSQYLDQISQEHMYLHFIDQKRGALKLEDIYVTLTLSPESLTGKRLSLDINGNLSQNMTSNFGKIDIRRDLGCPHRHYLEREIPLQELIFKRKVIILGDPGSGKTTLLRHLVIRTCKKEIFINKIPVFIKLADLQKKTACIEDYLENSYKYFYSYLYEGLTHGKLIFFLDGFDELSKDCYELIQREINRLASNKNHVFITCRTVAFPRGLFSSDYNIYECIGFNAAQQRRFLKRWFKQNPELSSKVQIDIQRNKGTFGLSKNPLLLSLMAIIYEKDPNYKLPIFRVDLYAKSIKILLEARKGKTIKHSIPKRERIKIFQKIAYTMFINESETIEEEDLLNMIDHYKEKSTSSQFLKSILSEDIMHVLVEKDGILTQHSTTSYRFLHLTFQEYFTASLISKDNNKLKLIYENIIEPRWEEVVRLLGGLLKPEKYYDILNYIWNSKINDTLTHDRLLLAGRCASDSPSIDINYLNKIKEELESIAFTTDIDTLSNDSLIALASLCSSYEQFFLSIINSFRNKMKKGDISSLYLYRYIKFMQLTSTEKAYKELIELYNIFLGIKINYEEKAQIISNILKALAHIGHEEIWISIFELLKSNSSYICSNAALTLATIQPEDVINKYKSILIDYKEYHRVMIAFVLYKYEEPNINEYLITEAFQKGMYDLQLLSIQCVNIQALNINESFVLNLIENCIDNESKAHLISIYSLFVYVFDYDLLIKNIIMNNEASIIVRCATIETIIRLYPDQSHKIFSYVFSKSSSIDLKIVALTTIPEINITSINNFLFKQINEKSDQRIILAYLRVLEVTTFEGAEDWFLNILNYFKMFSKIHSYAMIVLSSSGNIKAISYIKEYLKHATSNQIKERKIAYKCLGLLKCNECIDILSFYLFHETDILLINQIILSLGYTENIKAETPLITCLSPENWPKHWPSPKESLKKGEQRPSDRRRLSAVISLNNICSLNSLSYLQEILVDENESEEIREVVFIAIREIMWKLKMHNQKPMGYLNFNFFKTIINNTLSIFYKYKKE